MNLPISISRPGRALRFASNSCLLFICLFYFHQNARAWTLTCPEDYTIVLPTGSCGIFVNFDTLEWGSSVPLVDTVFIPANGSYIPTGTTTVVLATVDINGNIENCTFNVTVVAGISTMLPCPSMVQLSLQGHCERELVAEDVLDPTLNPCPGDYIVERLGPNGTPISTSINADDMFETFTLRLTNLETGATCETEATVTGGTPPSITCPPPTTVFCNVPLDTSNTGFPAFTGCYEDLQISYFDNTLEINCPDTFAFQVTRTWVATDPFGKQDVCQQLITGKRFNVNLIEFPPDFDGTGEAPLACNDTLNLAQVAAPSVTGVPLFGGFPAMGGMHCRVVVTFTDFSTQLCGASFEIKRVWSVAKICNPPLTVRDTQTIVVLDEAPPVFQLPDTIFVSLSPDCADSLLLPPAGNVIECSAYEVTIETPWDTLESDGGFIFFNPAAGSYPVVYRLADACGNIAEQTTTVKIENQTLVACPADDTISCNLYFDTIALALTQNNLAVLSILGMPEYYRNCDYVISETDSFLVNSCGVGFIQRRIENSSASDPVTCIQNIAVYHISDFEAQFPPDTAICGLPSVAAAGQPVIFNETCENVTDDFTDQTVQSGIPGCYTVFRTWEVKNTCTFNGDTSIPDPPTGDRRFADGGDGYIEYIQTIEVNNFSAPTFPAGCELPDVYLDSNNCAVPVTLTSPAVSGCGASPTLSVSGSLGTTPGSTAIVNPGSYTMTWQAADACGNVGFCVAEFEVFDTIAPVALCDSVVVAEVLLNGKAIVVAGQFDGGSSDNCTANLHFSFSPDIENDSLEFFCCDLGTYPIEIWATDPSGNQRSCNSVLVVQNSLGQCDCDLTISGEIATQAGAGINDVQVNVSGASGFSLDVATLSTGGYLAELPEGDDYIITPFKNTLPLNGVTTLDNVFLTKHILGLELLDSPYKIIAADVNNSGAVTTLDAVEIRKLILGLSSQFPNNTSWRFVDAAYNFINAANPLAESFPEVIFVNDLNGDLTGLDFIGVKTGDLNNSASPGFAQNIAVDRTGSETAFLTTEKRLMGADETFVLPFFLENPADLEGFQFALQFDQNHLSVLELRPGFAGPECFGLQRLGEGILTASWTRALALPVAANGPAFSVVLKAKTSGNLENWIRLEPNILQAEAYSPGLEILDLKIGFGERAAQEPKALRSVRAKPNPFRENTAIEISLSERSVVQLSLATTAGTVIFEKSMTLNEGRNELEINRKDLPAAGVYFFKISTETGSAEGKIVCLE